MIAPGALAKALAEYLPRQRWFSGSDAGPPELRVKSVEALRTEWPALLQVLVETRVAVGGQARTATYQAVLGLRPVDSREAFLEGKPEAILCEVDTDLGAALAYDALIDPELAVTLLQAVAPGEEAERARYLGADQSNTSVVFDERLIMKLFRRVPEGPNPDAEVTRALVDVGFTNVARPVAEWRGDAGDFAVVNEFLVGGAEGFALALTSLRDLYDRRCPPGEAGGDFAPESSRLGAITAGMHLALARAFGAGPGDADRWASDMEAHLDRVRLPGLDPDRVRAVYRRLREVADPGPALRVHGDYHLGQVMRTDAGWYVLDFEGEPDRPLVERRRPSSPLRDVSGLVRSFHYAAQVALQEWGNEPDPELAALASAWEQHNAAAFVAGYLGTERIHAVLPSADADRRLVQAAFELDKAVYEVGYEQSHRPDWVSIPLSAVHRILEAIT
ncbi:MAG: phosphotransferase [Actinomycetota bacterium]|nr:phosphotransferase [Actinomycetota bacterium]MDP9020121.1 phosphotransferase [Actinomycetota bacterium]